MEINYRQNDPDYANFLIGLTALPNKLENYLLTKSKGVPKFMLSVMAHSQYEVIEGRCYGPKTTILNYSGKSGGFIGGISMPINSWIAFLGDRYDSEWPEPVILIQPVVLGHSSLETYVPKGKDASSTYYWKHPYARIFEKLDGYKNEPDFPSDQYEMLKSWTPEPMPLPGSNLDHAVTEIKFEEV